ncbi:hypothetical protein [Marinibactrum halimedae]|uniref:Uncharacterized protein n=1 Tax=Marinibactrum halimedae TaxID=1444977 RepID=A0AA37WMH6_9GAMM|nr:hypothetical protein [Marinibactrum halimedae]MCD9461295.1 hypothetical protein [Marinibactrum halimedae]GLS26403.1 hypothetical protein GCM10007877_21180 [Marinibactrum halimedae]
MSLSYGENEANRTELPGTANLPAIYTYTADGRFSATGDWTNFSVEEGDDTREMTRIDVTWNLDDLD